ncbi:MAG: sel1 repeat family protein [Verrucomicrobia bacterium]|nr:sel1 repeat family protein [Verrucomicrobiota bacterium]
MRPLRCRRFAPALVLAAGLLSGCNRDTAAGKPAANRSRGDDPLRDVPRRHAQQLAPVELSGMKQAAGAPVTAPRAPSKNSRSAESNFREGLAYWEATGVDRDRAEAVKYFQLAADAGHARAAAFLGAAYRVGDGVAHDPVQTVKWFTVAAEQGHDLSQAILGSLYNTGECVEKNPVEAVKWFRAAAEQGRVEAMGNLGAMLFLGQGTTNNFVEAYKWLHLAAQAQNPLAIKNRGEVAKRLTAAQMAEGRKLATEFRARPTTNSLPAAATP